MSSVFSLEHCQPLSCLVCDLRKCDLNECHDIISNLKMSLADFGWKLNCGLSQCVLFLQDELKLHSLHINIRVNQTHLRLYDFTNSFSLEQQVLKGASILFKKNLNYTKKVWYKLFIIWVLLSVILRGEFLVYICNHNMEAKAAEPSVGKTSEIHQLNNINQSFSFSALRNHNIVFSQRLELKWTHPTWRYNRHGMVTALQNKHACWDGRY